MEFNLKGILPAVATAYDDEGRLSEARTERLYSHLVKNGVSGLFVGGSTGEWPLLTSSERKLEAEIAVACAGGNVPVIMHVSSMLPSEVLDYAGWARNNGVTAVSIVMPYYFLCREDGLYDFFSSIIPKIDLPVLIYNIPGNVKNVLTPHLLQRLSSDFPNVVGVKDSSMDFLRLQEFMQGNYARELSFFTGNDAQIIPACMYGANGAVSAAAGVFPSFVMRMYKAFASGDIETAKAMQEKVLRYRALVVTNPPMSVLKAALHIAGFDVGAPRAPLQKISGDEEMKLEQLIEKEGLLK